MKQITRQQAEKLALADDLRLKHETRYCCADFVRDNAHRIAAIENKECDKTYYGEWPKGWKAEMKRFAAEKARAAIIDRFIRENCKELDGAIWLGTWHLIEEISA